MKKILVVLYLAAISFLPAQAQMVISGKVAEKGNILGLPGVMVQVKDSQRKVITDYDGEFSIEVPGENAVLVFSKEGYVTQEVTLGSQTAYSITLTKSTPQTEDEVVKVGYGALTKEENTSTVSTIDVDKLGNQPVVDLEQANQGRAAGVFIQNSGGKLGQATRVRIRGGSSLAGSNEPLYVVDGVPLASNNQSDIDPSTVESIEILKDASAAALYGSRAANGVVLITTKKGEAGEIKVDLDYQFGVSTTPTRLDMMTADEYNQMLVEFTLRQPLLGFPQSQINQQLLQEIAAGAVGNPNYQYTYTLSNGQQASINFPVVAQSTSNTDWQDEAFRTATSHKANAGISFGSEKHRVYTGISYLNQEGILIGNQYERLGSKINVNSDWSDRLSTDLSFSYINTINNQLNEDADIGNPMQVILLPPSDRPNPANDYILEVRSAEYNPQTEVFNSDYIELTDRTNGSLAIGYELNDNLSINLDGGIDLSDIRNERRQGPATFEGAPSGLSRLSTSRIFNYLVNGYLDYNLTLDNGSRLSAIVGTSYQKSNSVFTFRQARVNSVAVLEDLPESDPTLLELPVPGSAFSFLSYYGRVNYTINRKYSLQLSGRADGSSKFGEDNRYGFFPAVSAGWNISNESFLSGSERLSFLKLKASYGIVGNTPDADFLYRQNYFNVFYGNNEGIRLANLSNSELKWEETAQLDIGVDFGFFSDKISGSVNYYNKKTTDLIFPVPVSQTSGFGSVFKNVGSLTNAGFEFALSSINVDRSNFQWTTDFNISSNRNEITDLGGERLISGVNAFIEGQPAGAFFMLEYRGSDPNTGNPVYWDGFKEVVVNNDSEYNNLLESSRAVQGNPNPRFFGGLTNSMSMGRFDLDFTFQFVQGVDVYWETGEFIANSGFALYGQTADQVDRWYNAADGGEYPRLNPNVENPQSSSRWLVDGSYIRLNTLTFGYRLPDQWVQNLGMRYFSLYVGGQNLFTISDYPGYDPDVGYVDPNGGTIAQNINRGIDFFTAPQPRIITTGLKIGF